MELCYFQELNYTVTYTMEILILITDVHQDMDR